MEMRLVPPAPSRYALFLVNTMPTRDITHPSDRLIAAMERLFSYRMTTTSGGNLSSLDEEGSSWITQSMIARQEE